MLNILSTEPELPVPAEETLAPESTDYELVLGRRQMASVTFVAIVALVTFSAVAFLAGKSEQPTAPSPTVFVNVPVRVPGPPQPILIAPDAVKPVAPAASVAPANANEPPVFADPQKNATYLQMGAVDRGVAAVLAQGLRKYGLPSFVAPGPNDKIFRVLIGPLPDEQTYRTVKAKVDSIGITAFAKTYVN